MARLAHGWKRKNPNHPMLFLKHYVMNPRAVTVPDLINWTNLPVYPYSIIGNDDYGDCVEAGEYHADQVLGADYQPTASDALGLYSSLTGFNPNNPSTDQGTDIPTALDYWLTNPLPGSGTRLGAYASLDVRDLTEVALALYLGGAVLVGGDLPYSAEQQFNANMPWTVVPGSPIVGGHCWTVTMNTSSASIGGGITWGQYQQWTYKWWNKYVAEAYVLFAEEWVAPPNGVAPNHIAWSDLNADITSLWGIPGPFTGQTNPPVVPPSGLSSLQVLQGIKPFFDAWDGVD